jgi:Fic family protein
MSPENAPAFSPETLRQIDAQYRAFPPFESWCACRVDDERWRRAVARVEQRRAGTDAAALRRAFDLVKRAAAVDTGAIEGLYEVDRGFTFTVAGAVGLWELELDKKGAEVRSLIEGQFGAYDLAVDAATQAQPISEALVRRFHEELCRAQKTYLVQTAVGPQQQGLPLGEYKHHPNHVRQRDGSIHAYCPVDLVPAEMHRLCAELRRPEFETAHPVLQASYVHYAFVSVHPFADGNGRVARLLASVYLCRAHSIPFLVLADEKKAYLDALIAADAGQPQAFVDFTFERGIETFRLVADSLATAAAPSAEEAGAEIRRMFASPHTSLDTCVVAGRLLMKLFQEEFKRRAQQYVVDKTLRQNTIEAPRSGAFSLDPQSNSTYRWSEYIRYVLSIADPSHPMLDTLRLSSPIRMKFSVSGVFQVEVPRDHTGHILLRWFSLHQNSFERIELDVDLDELLPEPKKALHLRISLAVERVLGQILDDLAKLAADKLDQHGY